MCGIVGELDNRGPIDPVLFDAMRDSLAHRGPDGAGSVLLADGAVALGHRRLAILDLSPTGHQPMRSADGRCWLVFNGEIYNYRELRAELTALGHQFQGTGDSEVLLHAYQEWGEACLDRLAGMFAFALWDGEKQCLFLARDRFGIKPLYYYQADGHVIFASEPRAIIRHPAVPRRMDSSALRFFFLLRHIPAPASIWSGIAKLPPGHCLTLDARGRGTPRPYWRLSPGRTHPDPGHAREMMLEALAASVRDHLLSDVPVGMLLSGGLDSGSILALSRRLGAPSPCYTIGFSGWEKSEHKAAASLADALGADHHLLMMEGVEEDLFPRMAETYDEPLGDTSQWPTMALAALARRHVKVALGGDGGDELLGGYRWYEAAGQGENELSTYAEAMTWAQLDGPWIDRLLPFTAGLSLPTPLELFTSRHDPSLGPVKALQMLDFEFFLPGVVLAKLDRASMAVGLEARVPFLDHRLVEQVMAWDESVYRPGGIAKPWLSHLLSHAAPTARRTQGKQGFGGPLNRYVGNKVLAAQVLQGSAVRDGVLDAGAVAALGRQGTMPALYAANVFAAWYERWVRT